MRVTVTRTEITDTNLDDPDKYDGYLDIRELFEDETSSFKDKMYFTIMALGPAGMPPVLSAYQVVVYGDDGKMIFEGAYA